MSSSKKKSRASQPQKQKAATAAPPESGPAPVPGEKPGAGTAAAAAAAAPKPAGFKGISPAFLMLAGILALALAVRLLPLLYCVGDGRVQFQEFDPYYHMRLITYAIEHFPATSIYDSYVDYPNGYFVGWPPLFDLAAAAASLVVGLGSPDRFTAEIVSSALPVAFGLLGILAAYFLVRDAMGEKAALLAALVMAILPATVFRTSFGYVDHHALEMLLSVGMFLFFLRGASRGKAQGLSLKNVAAGRGPAMYAALAGVAIAAAVFAWDGAPIFVGILLLYALAQYAYDAYRKESSEYLTVTGVIASLVALALVAPFAITGYHGQQMEISAIFLSWFQVIMLAAAAAFFLAMGLLSAGLARQKAPWYALPGAAIVAGGVLVAATGIALPRFFSNLEAGVAFLLGSGQVAGTISEARSLFSDYGTFSLWTAWIFVTTAALIAVPGFLLYLLEAGKRKPGSMEIFIILWTITVAALTVLQARFVYLLGVNLAIFAGYGAARALGAAGLERFIDTTFGEKGKARRRFRFPWALAATAAIVALLLAPALYYSYEISGKPMQQTADWNEAARWISENTPPTSHVYSAGIGTRPEYGVMTWWDYGNFILYSGERPAVANNFQTGIEDAANFFIAQNETAADRIMEERNARYVAADLKMGALSAGIPGGIFENIPRLAGENASTYFMSYRMLDPTVSGTSAYTEGNDKYYSTMYSRLFNDLGCGGRNRLGNITSGLEHYRLAYATRGLDPVVVFEKVPGAVIRGSAAPGAKVKLAMNLSIGDKSVTYCSQAVADQSGAYRFTVPYATGDTASFVKTAPAYTITSGSGRAEVAVPADAVAGGEAVDAGGFA